MKFLQYPAQIEVMQQQGDGPEHEWEATVGSLAGPVGIVVGFVASAAAGAYGGAFIYDSFSSPSNSSSSGR